MAGALPLRLVFKNLFRHPVRSALTAASLTVAFFLLCTLQSLVVTLDAGVEDAKSDRLVVQSAVSLYVILPESYDAKIRSVEGVEGTCRWTWFGGYYQNPSNFFAQFATSEQTLFSIYPELSIVEGSAERFMSDRSSCLVGEELAAVYRWKVGDTVPLIGTIFPRTDGSTWNFRIAGIYRSSAASVDNRTMFFHHEYLSKSLEDGAANGPDGVGVYVVKVKDGADVQSVMSRIDGLFAKGPQRVQTTTEAEFQAQFVSMVGNIPFFVSSIGMAVFFAILLAVLNTMLMAAREQTHDAGILKALGFGGRTVFLVLMLQSLALSVVGGGLGVLAAVGSSAGIRHALGSMFPLYEVTTETTVAGLIGAVVLGLVAGLVPALRLGRLSCVAALRLEK